MDGTMVASVLSLLFVSAVSQTRPSGLMWSTSYASTAAVARKMKRPMMLVLLPKEPGVGPGVKPGGFFQDPAVVRALAGHVALKVGPSPDGFALARQYKVHSFPTVLLLDPDGRLAWRIRGQLPPMVFADIAQRSISATQEFGRLSAYLKSKPRDVAAAADYAVLACARDRFGDARRALNAAGAVSVKNASPRLAEAWNALGDSLQTTGNPSAAIPLFSRALTSSGFPLAYARISIASCYLMMRQPKKAVPYLKALERMGPPAQGYSAAASQMLLSLGRRRPTTSRTPLAQ
jgi:hypothetical protein